MKKLSILLFLFLFAYACDPCKDVTCVNGTCVDGTCECFAGFTGSSCEIDMCASVTCDHGSCVAGVCQCDEGWEGTLCDECEIDCGDHGECDDDGECECDDGWTGDLCDDQVQTGLCTNTCQYHDDGECDDGGPGSDYSVCTCGTDCADCGTRTTADCEGTGGDSYISVWTSIVSFPCNTQQIDVYIDDDYIGYLDSYCPTSPECGDACTLIETVTAGSHEVYAECNNGDTYWGPGTVSVSEGYCYLLELTEKSFSVVPTKYRNK